MADTSTTRDCVWGSVTTERDKAFMTTVAPLKLWLKQLDSETLEVLYNKSVVACTKAKLLGQRNEAAYRANRIREIAHRELEYHRKKQESGAQ